MSTVAEADGVWLTYTQAAQTELARSAGLDHKQLRRLADRGAIRKMRLPGCTIRIRIGDLARLIESSAGPTQE